MKNEKQREVLPHQWQSDIFTEGVHHIFPVDAQSLDEARADVSNRLFAAAGTDWVVWHGLEAHCEDMHEDYPAIAQLSPPRDNSIRVGKVKDIVFRCPQDQSYLIDPGDQGKYAEYTYDENMRDIDWNSVDYAKARKVYEAGSYDKALADVIGSEMWQDYKNQKPAIFYNPETGENQEVGTGLSLRSSGYFTKLLNTDNRLTPLDLDTAAVLYLAASNIAFRLQEKEC